MKSLVIGPCHAHVEGMVFHLTEFTHRTPVQDYRIQAPMPIASAATRQLRCPNCDHPAVAPVVSTYLGDGQVENEWLCSACGFAWTSGFNGLQV